MNLTSQGTTCIYRCTRAGRVHILFRLTPLETPRKKRAKFLCSCNIDMLKLVKWFSLHSLIPSFSNDYMLINVCGYNALIHIWRVELNILKAVAWGNLDSAAILTTSSRRSCVSGDVFIVDMRSAHCPNANNIWRYINARFVIFLFRCKNNLLLRLNSYNLL